MPRKKDYPELEGKEIRYFIPNNPDWEERDTTAIVAGCSFDIGITIVEKETKTELVCLNRKYITGKGVKWAKAIAEETGEALPDIPALYEKDFYELVDAIKKGEVNGLTDGNNTDSFLIKDRGPRSFIGMAECPFLG